MTCSSQFVIQCGLINKVHYTLYACIDMYVPIYTLEEFKQFYIGKKQR